MPAIFKCFKLSQRSSIIPYKQIRIQHQPFVNKSSSTQSMPSLRLVTTDFTLAVKCKPSRVYPKRRGHAPCAGIPIPAGSQSTKKTKLLAECSTQYCQSRLDGVTQIHKLKGKCPDTAHTHTHTAAQGKPAYKISPTRTAKVPHKETNKMCLVGVLVLGVCASSLSTPSPSATS